MYTKLAEKTPLRVYKSIADSEVNTTSKFVKRQFIQKQNLIYNTFKEHIRFRYI